MKVERHDLAFMRKGDAGPAAAIDDGVGEDEEEIRDAQLAMGQIRVRHVADKVRDLAPDAVERCRGGKEWIELCWAHGQEIKGLLRHAKADTPIFTSYMPRFRQQASGETMERQGELDPRRKRLIFRSGHRGVREMDLILEPFAKAYVADLTGDELDQYESLLEIPDADLFYWITGEKSVPDAFLTSVLTKVLAFGRRNSPSK
jgi:antitoxin CptB